MPVQICEGRLFLPGLGVEYINRLYITPDNNNLNNSRAELFSTNINKSATVSMMPTAANIHANVNLQMDTWNFIFTPSADYIKYLKGIKPQQQDEDESMAAVLRNMYFPFDSMDASLTPKPPTNKQSIRTDILWILNFTEKNFSHRLTFVGSNNETFLCFLRGLIFKSF